MIAFLGLVLSAAFVASAAITPWVIRGARARGFLDLPDGNRRIHTVAVPRLGGVAVFAAMVVGLFVSAVLAVPATYSISASPNFLGGVLVGGGILFLAGVIDDVIGLRPITKLLTQVLAALVLCAFGISIQSFDLGSNSVWNLGALSVPFTVLWVVAVTNSFNLIDGMDGLATGIAIVALLTLLALSLTTQRSDVAVVCVALIGALAGFLPYNFNPARIFLGDSGSLFVGFMLAVLSVHGATASAATTLAVGPLFALALPLLDTILAMGRRWLRGLPVSSADRRHIHHRLLAIGLTTRRAVLILYAVSCFFAMIGVLVAFAPPRAIALITLAGGGLTIALIAAALHRLDYHEFAAVHAAIAQGPMKLRKMLRDRINAEDIARLIPSSRSLAEINAILLDHVELFQFGHMEVCRLNSMEGLERIGTMQKQSAWKLDYTVGPYSENPEEWYVLRVWCYRHTGTRPFGAERVAGILGPAIHAWMLDQPEIMDQTAHENLSEHLQYT